MNSSKNNNIRHIINSDGAEFWKDSDGNLHQNEDVPAMISSNGTEKYWKKGYSTRKYGPRSKEPDGTEWWQINWNIIGLNREDAAAIIWPDGIRTYIKTELPRRWETNKS